MILAPQPTLRAALTGLKATIAQVAFNLRHIPIQLALLNFVYGRICRANTRFERLYAKWQAGTLPKPRLRPNRIHKPRPPRVMPPIGNVGWSAMTFPPCPVPTRRFWLRDILGNNNIANISALQVQAYLSTEEITRFRAEFPTIGRILRPLCRLLEITLPDPNLPSPAPFKGRAGEGAQPMGAAADLPPPIPLPPRLPRQGDYLYPPPFLSSA